MIQKFSAAILLLYLATSCLTGQDVAHIVINGFAALISSKDEQGDLKIYIRYVQIKESSHFPAYPPEKIVIVKRSPPSLQQYEPIGELEVWYTRAFAPGESVFEKIVLEYATEKRIRLVYQSQEARDIGYRTMRKYILYDRNSKLDMDQDRFLSPLQKDMLKIN